VYHHIHPLNSHLNVTRCGADEETAAHVTASEAGHDAGTLEQSGAVDQPE
jgi:hypothetical protein